MLQANAPRTRPVAASRAELAAMLGVAEPDVAPDPAKPPLWVDAGVEQLVIPLASANAVRRAAPKADLLLTHGRAGNRAMAYVFAHDKEAQPLDAERRWSPASFSRSTARWSRIPVLDRPAPISVDGCSCTTARCPNRCRLRKAMRWEGRAGWASKSARIAGFGCPVA
jgi:hypothetical protein